MWTRVFIETVSLALVAAVAGWFAVDKIIEWNRRTHERKAQDRW